MKTGKCAECERSFERDRLRRPAARTTCSVVCRNRLIARTRQTDYHFMKGANNPNWNDGTMMSQGYVYIKMPDHPNANKHGYVKRANLVLEKRLGRFLTPREEVAHHKDRNRLNDSPKNLQLKSRLEHNRLHANEGREAQARLRKGTS